MFLKEDLKKVPIIGAFGSLALKLQRESASQNFVIGCFILSALLFFIIFFFNRRTQESLYFGIFSFAYGMHLMFFTADYFNYLFPGISYVVSYKIGYLFTFISIAGFWGFLQKTYPKDVNRPLFYFIIGLHVLMVLFTLFAPLFYVSATAPIYFMGIAPVLVLYTLYVFGKTLYFKRIGKKYNLLAMLSIVLVSAMLIIKYLTDIDIPYLIPPVIYLLFLFSQILIIINKFSAELKYIFEQAESPNRPKNEFIATMSHELRTPLNAIMGMANMLKSSVDDPTSQTKVDTIVQNTEKLTSIINDILNLSDLQSGNITLKFNEFNVRKNIEQALELVNHFRKGKDIKVNIKMDSKVPDVLVGDELRINQLMIHMLSNAFKFTEKGLITIDVKMGRSLKENQIELLFEISDTGIGIPKNKLSYLFSSFNQLDSSHTRKSGGISLGLALSNKLVRLMGGKITAETVVNQGTTFSFNLFLNAEIIQSEAVKKLFIRKMELDRV